MEQNELEKKAEDQLIHLMEEGKYFLDINFIPRSEMRSMEQMSSISYGESLVKLHLIEPLNGYDLQRWLELFKLAEERIELLKKERIHELSNPIFFKRIRNKVRYSKENNFPILERI